MLKDTPLRGDQNSDNSFTLLDKRSRHGGSHFKLPETPSREELGHLIANQNLKERRERKAKEKRNHLSKLGLASGAAARFDATSEQMPLKSPISMVSAKLSQSNNNVKDATSVRSMLLMTPRSVKSSHSLRSLKSHLSSSSRRPCKEDFSKAGQQLLSKLVKK